MHIRIAKPMKYLETLDISGDVKVFFEMLPRILERMGVDYKVLELQRSRQIFRAEDAIYLAWHLHGNLPDIWHLKPSYLVNYFYFDRNGYSGWSELAQEYNYDVDVNSIRDEVQQFADNYIANNVSRFPQPEHAYIPDEPYVLVLTQMSNDSVTDHAYIHTNVLLQKVAEVYKGSKYKVCVKAHPLSRQFDHHPKPYRTPDIFEATGSIHKIIAGATAVYTMNSGAGFEALLHGKRVFTTGHCDYHWVTDVIKTDADLQASIDIIEQPVDKDRIIKFLHYCLNYHFATIDDEASIERKLQRVIDEYAQL